MLKRIYPSLIAADVLNLERVVKQLDPYCAGYHIDIMDNHFVPNLTCGPMFANALGTVTTKPCAVHFMVDDPDSLISRLTLAPQSPIYIHIELGEKIIDTIKLITEKKLSAGLAISPKTPVEEILPFLSLTIHHVLIMSVEPGFSGQSFIPDVIDKIEPLIAYRTSKQLNFSLAMDGSIDETNINELAKRGVTDFSVGSGIFGHKDPVTSLKNLNR